MKTLLMSILLLFLHTMSFSQSIAVVDKGKTGTEPSRETVSYSNIIVLDAEPLVGETPDMAGNTYMASLHVGYHNFQIRMMGWKRFVFIELLVSKSQQAYLDADLSQEALDIDKLVPSTREITSSRKDFAA